MSARRNAGVVIQASGSDPDFARLALVPSLVAERDLASAVAINSIVFNLARFIGPMFAGLAIVWSANAGARAKLPTF